ncbi:ISAs1 family transposase [Endozoicomonas sp. ALC013]|uniref:ISAs1 family transposase n=1 Tax=Endozoicomonas sp. ALC013 TaxID=3403076 RepID=UPI003BB5AED1
MLKPAPLITFMVDVEDSRKNPNRCEHKLIDILMIALCCIMSNGESWEDMESYGKKKFGWLKTFLALPNGIPSHDTFYRVFTHLNTASFQKCFLRWIKSAFPDALPEGEYTDIIPIDGKSIKGSRGKGKGKRAVHMVSAWSHRLGLVLGQQKVDSKSNEITAVPTLMEALDMQGALITADAMSCQKSIASTCIEQGADYLLAVKGNQETLQKDIQEAVEKHWELNPKDELSDVFAEQENKGHGHHEYRCCWVFTDLNLLSTHAEWQGIKQFGVVQADRTINNKVTTALRFYISSKSMSAHEMLNATRIHWEVENKLHWVLDVSFNEDACQTKHENGAENLSTLRRLALNIFKMDRVGKGSIRRRRNDCAWDDSYLTELLEQFIFTSVNHGC